MPTPGCSRRARPSSSSTAPWTATINGKVTSSNFSGGGNAAIYLGLHAPFAITIGETAEIAGTPGASFAETGADIINKGSIVGAGASGYGIQHTVIGGDYKINNSGEHHWRRLRHRSDACRVRHLGGIHTIVNSGLIQGPTAIYSIHDLAFERLTNSGQIVGTIDLGGGDDSIVNSGTMADCYLGDGNDSFTNTGTVTGVVDLEGIDRFRHGNDKFTNGGVVSAFVRAWRGRRRVHQFRQGEGQGQAGAEGWRGR